MVPETSPLSAGKQGERNSNSIAGPGTQTQSQRIEQHEGVLPKSTPPQTRQVPDRNAEITYRYLTFDTPLPTPNTTLSSSTSPRPPPLLPNLRRYINPFLWSPATKNTHLALSCIATFLTAYTAGAYSPPTPLIARDLNADLVSVIVGITTFCLGFAFAPMLLAPFSETNGRYPIFVVSGVIFIAAIAACGASTNLAGMLVARLLVGVGGSVFSTMIGGVIADIWRKEERNTPMALFSGFVLGGTGFGPLVGGIFADRFAGDEQGEGVVGGVGARWRWVFWHQVVTASLLMVALGVMFRESRGSVVLSRRAGRLNRWFEEREQQGWFGVWAPRGECGMMEGGNGLGGGNEKSGMEQAAGHGSAATTLTKTDAENQPSSTPTDPQRLLRIRYLVAADQERRSLALMIRNSLVRPFHLLFTEPVVFFFSLWAAFSWAVLYLTFGSIPYVFTTVYGFSLEQSCRVFAAMAVGSAVATVIGISQERLLLLPGWQADSASPSPFWRFMRRSCPAEAPESRLYFACVTATLLPIGLFLFGFSAHPSVPFEVPALAICLATMGIYSVYLASFNYLADVYGTYASSALAAQSFSRNILGGVFPLVTGPLFRNLGPRGAGAILGSVALMLTAVPWVLVWFGETIRRRSRFAVQLGKEGQVGRDEGTT